MDEYPGKRIHGGIGFSKRTPGISFRNQNHEDKSSQHCNRLGSSTKLNPTKVGHTDSSEKPRFSRPSLRSNTGKATAGTMSKEAFVKLQREQQPNPTFLGKIDIPESSSRRARIEDRLEDLNYDGSASSSKPSKQNSKCLSLGNVGISSKPRISTVVPKPSHGLKNLSCTSISDVLPAGCSSSSDLGRGKRISDLRTRPSNGESSSAPTHNIPCHSLPILEGPIAQQSVRRIRNQAINRDGPVSVRTWRSSITENKTRPSMQRDESAFPLNGVPEVEITQFSVQEAVPESISGSFTLEQPWAFRSSARPGSSSRTAHTRSSPTSHPQENSSEISHGLLGDGDGIQHLSMEGIAQVLLALERIEQYEDLTYEQLLVLETNFLLGGMSFHDQHRDMRMDIDDMSYEELLALEEKMGSVSTALSEEDLAKCLKRSIHTSSSLVPGINGRVADDIKCSICQEEYVAGDEVGKLGCDHKYHIVCVHQWLRLKNWCPICKASAAPACRDK